MGGPPPQKSTYILSFTNSSIYTRILTLPLSKIHPHTNSTILNTSIHSITCTQNIHHIHHNTTHNTPYHNHSPSTQPPTLQTPLYNRNYIPPVYHTQHTHLKIPKNKPLQCYTWTYTTFILSNGLIYLHPRLVSSISKNLSQNYTQSQYLLPNALVIESHHKQLNKIFTLYPTPIILTYHNHGLTYLETHRLTRQCITKNTTYLVTSNHINNFQINSYHKYYTHPYLTPIIYLNPYNHFKRNLLTNLTTLIWLSHIPLLIPLYKIYPPLIYIPPTQTPHAQSPTRYYHYNGTLVHYHQECSNVPILQMLYSSLYPPANMFSHKLGNHGAPATYP